jgi:hypothetical protein
VDGGVTTVGCVLGRWGSNPDVHGTTRAAAGFASLMHSRAHTARLLLV